MAFRLGQGVVELGIGGLAGFSTGVSAIKSKLAGVTNSITQMGFQMKIAWAGGLAAAGLAVKAALAQEEADRHLEHILKQTGNTTGYTTDQLKGLASELQSLTGIDDDTAENVLAIFAGMENISGDNLKSALTLSADLADHLGGDLVSNARLLAKALNDPAQGMGMLRKAGVQLTEEEETRAKEMQAMGRGLEAQTMLVDKLKGKIGGLATEMGNTAAGKIRRLNAAFGDLREGIGFAVLDLITPMLDRIRELTSGLTEWVSQNQKLATGLIAVAGAFTGLLAFSPQVIGAFQILKVLFAAFSGPVGLVVAGLVMISKYLIGAYVEGDTFIQKLGNLGETLRSFFGPIIPTWEEFTGLVTSSWNYITDITATVWNSVVAGIRTALAYIKVAFVNWELSLKIALVGVVVGVLEFWDALKYTFTDAIPTLLQWFGRNWYNIFVDIVGFTSTVFENMWTNITGFFSNLWTWIKDVFAGNKTKWEFVWTPITEGFVASTEKIPELFANMVDGPLTQRMKGVLGQYTSEFNDKLQAELGGITTQNAVKINVEKVGEKATEAAAKLDAPTVKAPKFDTGGGGKSGSVGLADAAKNMQLAALKAAAVVTSPIAKTAAGGSAAGLTKTGPDPMVTLAQKHNEKLDILIDTLQKKKIELPGSKA